LSWKVIGVALDVDGARKVRLPLGFRVPCDAQVVPGPCAGVQLVVLVDDQFSVMLLPGSTLALVGEKLVMLGAATAVHWIPPFSERTLTSPVVASMLTALCVVDVVKANAAVVWPSRKTD
jgi:hypothetical protein